MLWSLGWIELDPGHGVVHLYSCVLHLFRARVFTFGLLFQVGLFSGKDFLSIIR